MADLTVYDSQGDEFDPQAEELESSDEIADLALQSVKLVAKISEKRVIGYVRAAASEYSRAEQFYVEYQDSETTAPLRDFMNAMEITFDGWSYEIRLEDDGSKLLRVMDNLNRTRFPDQDEIAETIIGMDMTGDPIVVTTPTFESALGLFRSVGKQSNVAITTTHQEQIGTDVDVIFVVGNEYSEVNIEE